MTKAKKYFAAVLMCLLTYFIVFWLSSDDVDHEASLLLNISSSAVNLEITKNIFFIESSPITNNGEVALNSRQACSIESAAIMNPNHLICVIIVNNSNLKKLPIVDSLKKYKNIVFYRLNLEDFSRNTPVESWIKSKLLYKTGFLRQNIANILRLLLLWR